MELAPIVLFVYNRPRHTQKTVEALQKNELACDSELFIYADGPKDNDANKSEVDEVRQYLKKIEGFKKVTVFECSRNLGLAGSIIRGVTEVVKRYGKVIVLEDDLVTEPGFLCFMNQALVRYETEEKVMQVSGYMFDVDIDNDSDAIFLPFISSWGWATWQRAWEHFEPRMIAYEILKKNRCLRYHFDLEGTSNFFRMLELQIKGKIDSWAIRWYLSVFMAGGLTLFPISSLVQNIGFDGSGVHCGQTTAFIAKKRDNVSTKSCYRFPEVFIEKDIFHAVTRFMLSRQSISKKLKYALSRLSETFWC